MISFEWDEIKAETNRQRHGLIFQRAKFVFEDPCALSEQDRAVAGELRWQTMGLVEGIAILLVAHTITERDEDELFRIIRETRESA